MLYLCFTPKHFSQPELQFGASQSDYWTHDADADMPGQAVNNIILNLSFFLIKEVKKVGQVVLRTSIYKVWNIYIDDAIKYYSKFWRKIGKVLILTNTMQQNF